MYVPNFGIGLILNISNLHNTSPIVMIASAILILSETGSPYYLLRL